MKKVITLLYFLAVSTALWAQPRSGEMIVKCNSLEKKDGQVMLDMDITVPRAGIDTRNSYEITPQLTSTDGIRTQDFPSVLVNGHNRQNIFERHEKFGWHDDLRASGQMPRQVVGIEGRTGEEVIRYTAAVPYQTWMDGAALGLSCETGMCAGGSSVGPLALVAPAALASAVAYVPQLSVSMAVPEKEAVKKRNVEARVSIDYHVGRSVIDPVYMRNPEELRKISDLLQDVRNNPDATITEMSIVGYASPEGTYELNERLARDRAAAMAKYIGDNLNVDRRIIKTSSVAEDWDGLVKLVENSDIAEKERILSIIRNVDVFDGRERELMDLAGGEPYRRMKAEMFPLLRHSDYRIDFDVRDYSTSDSKAVFERNPELLSLHELYLLAESYPEGSPEYNRVYEAIDRLYPNNPAAQINVAILEYRRGDYKEAERRLMNYGYVPEAVNALGAVYLAQGELDKAEERFRHAQRMGSPEAEHNLAEVAKVRDGAVVTSGARE